MSSAMSGFFFWGMMDEPVAKLSDRAMKRNSDEHQRMISSAIRLKCIIRMERSAESSSTKSRSDTPSSEFSVAP